MGPDPRAIAARTANDDYLAKARPSLDDLHAQVRTLTEQMQMILAGGQK